VKVEHLYNLGPLRAKHGVPRGLEGCHTAVVNGYVLEGHVPADTIRRLLRERPRVTGLAVPGMPVGSPGMESPGQAPERYRVMTFDPSGRTTVYESR
jgi:hypothetical protein